MEEGVAADATDEAAAGTEIEIVTAIVTAIVTVIDVMIAVDVMTEIVTAIEIAGTIATETVTAIAEKKIATAIVTEIVIVIAERTTAIATVTEIVEMTIAIGTVIVIVEMTTAIEIAIDEMIVMIATEKKIVTEKKIANANAHARAQKKQRKAPATTLAIGQEEARMTLVAAAERQSLLPKTSLGHPPLPRLQGHHQMLLGSHLQARLLLDLLHHQVRLLLATPHHHLDMVHLHQASLHHLLPDMVRHRPASPPHLVALRHHQVDFHHKVLCDGRMQLLMRIDVASASPGRCQFSDDNAWAASPRRLGCARCCIAHEAFCV